MEIKKSRKINDQHNSFVLAENYLKDYYITTYNGLIQLNYSGLTPGNSCMNYLIFITNNIYNSFDKGHEKVIKGAFLDISKIFDRV